ncbi:RICIN domain-containing protein [Streptomyces sp. SP18CS02]|uniref:RICIN domain-containing protein n=1 Tax=Streptomyces sp. SP18CS02 TaxID=3002531 RepID=UPI002E7A32E9|nr:RICIN domain-containing protein [Streptomyces sp. SP18CS02]MEE1754460.1 RICIN domain-containing protein [Streptomyces sp. SP18CS02]
MRFTWKSPCSRRRRRRTALGVSVTAVAALVTGGLDSPPAAADTEAAPHVTVRLLPDYQHQPFEGWGTSLAWFANVTGGWPDAQRNRLADALYGSKGLGFTIARYNIGGGDSPETKPYLRTGGAVPGHWNRPGAESPGWWNPANPSHWNPGADANQRWWLKAAKARGADTFEAFSNSPPYFMTNSGLVSGAVNGGEDNLRSDQYERFADYLSGALRRVQNSTGVTFDSLSPVNEPDTDFWRAGGRQEGSHWATGSQARMIAALRAELDSRGLGTPIATMDETNPEKFRTNWEAYSSPVRSMIGKLNTHTYGTGGRTGARDIAKGAGTPLWMSEVDLGGTVPQSFTDMSPALDLADRITDDIRELEPRAWVLWQAVEDYENMTPAHENSNWGLIQTDFTPADAAKEPLRKNKKYWVMAQYSRFIRPGDRIINSDDTDTLAAVRPGGRGAVVVHTNPTGSPRTVTLDLSGFQNVSPAPVQRYTTDAGKNLRREANVTATGKRLTVTLAPGSVTTLVLPGVSGVNAAAATAGSGTPQQLVNDHSGMALAVDTTGGKGVLVQRAPDPADSAQQWVLARTSPADWSTTASYRLKNVRSGKVLSNTRGGLALATHGASTQQRWMLSTTGDGHHTVISRATGDLLDVTGASTADGAPVGVHRPTTGGNQSWTFRTITTDPWKPLPVRHSGKCLDVTGASTADGTAVTQHACNGGTNQQWSLRATAGGHVQIMARHSGKCLDVAGAATADGALVTQYTCNGGRNQEWSVRTTGQGYVNLVARHSGKCLDVTGASTADGALVTQYTCNGGTNQQLRTA